MEVQTIMQKHRDHKKNISGNGGLGQFKVEEETENLSYLIGLGIKKPEFQFWLFP